MGTPEQWPSLNGLHSWPAGMGCRMQNQVKLVGAQAPWLALVRTSGLNLPPLLCLKSAVTPVFNMCMQACTPLLPRFPQSPEPYFLTDDSHTQRKAQGIKAFKGDELAEVGSNTSLLLTVVTLA